MGKCVTVKAKVRLPIVPNFLSYPCGTIAVGDVTDDDLKIIGEKWTKALLANAERQRTNNIHEEIDEKRQLQSVRERTIFMKK